MHRTLQEKEGRPHTYHQAQLAARGGVLFGGDVLHVPLREAHGDPLLGLHVWLEAATFGGTKASVVGG